MNTDKPASPTLHEQYWALSFRPMVRLDGSVGMVGISSNGPACCEPEIYQNLLMASPALYAQLHVVKEVLQTLLPSFTEEKSHAMLVGHIEQCELALTFAQCGYSMPKIDLSQFGENG